MEERKTSVSTIVGMVTAVIALLLSAVPIINNFAFILAIIGLVLGLIGLRSKSGHKGGKLAISVVVISVLAGGIVLLSQQFYSDTIDSAVDEASTAFDESMAASTGEKTEELLGTDVEVDLGKFNVTKDEFGLTDTELTVTVANKLNESKSYTIHIEAVDESGKRIADDYVYANDLGAGQAQEFKVFQFVESEKVDKLQASEFKIVTVSQM